MNPIEQVWAEIRKRGFKNKALKILDDLTIYRKWYNIYTGQTYNQLFIEDEFFQILILDEY